MRLFIDYQHDIARLFIRMCIRLAVEYILFTVRRSLINITRQDLLLFDYFFSITVLALFIFINCFTSTSALVAWASLLRIHSWAKLHHLRHHTSPFTFRACNAGAILSSTAVTLETNPITINGKLRCFTLEYFLQCDFQSMLYIFSLLGTALWAASSTTKHLFK